MSLALADPSLAHGAYVAYLRPECLLALQREAALTAICGDDERARAARFRFAEDRVVYLTAHVLTRVLLARLLGTQPQALVFARREHGRPELAGAAAQSGLRFNLSHTLGLAACAVTLDADIGVDVERIDRRYDLSSLERRVFSAQERAGLMQVAGAARDKRFFELWTLKEAYVKAIGKGLTGPLPAISFLPENPDPVPVQFAADIADDPLSWCLRRHVLAPRHQLAVALRRPASAQVRFEDALTAAWFRAAF